MKLITINKTEEKFAAWGGTFWENISLSLHHSNQQTPSESTSMSKIMHITYFVQNEQYNETEIK